MLELNPGPTHSYPASSLHLSYCFSLEEFEDCKIAVAPFQQSEDFALLKLNPGVTEPTTAAKGMELLEELAMVLAPLELWRRISAPTLAPPLVWAG